LDGLLQGNAVFELCHASRHIGFAWVSVEQKVIDILIKIKLVQIGNSPLMGIFRIVIRLVQQFF
jgi:hypothetical protein